jgi:hypothetical protein
VTDPWENESAIDDVLGTIDGDHHHQSPSRRLCDVAAPGRLETCVRAVIIGMVTRIGQNNTYVASCPDSARVYVRSSTSYQSL